MLRCLVSSQSHLEVTIEKGFFCKALTIERASIAQWLAYLIPHPAAPGSIPSIPDFSFSGKIVNAAEVNQRHCLEESGQWLEIVDRTHLVLVSGKAVLRSSNN